MKFNSNELFTKLKMFSKEAINKKVSLTEEELRSIFLNIGILKELGFHTIGKDIRLEKTISRKLKRADILCLDDFGNNIVIIEFKKPGIKVPLENYFNQLWKKYILPLKAKYGILTQGIEIVVYRRIGINEHIILRKSISDLKLSTCEIFSQLCKPEYDICDLTVINDYFKVFRDPFEQIELKEEYSRNFFFESFNLTPDSLFGNLLISIIKYFQNQYKTDTFLTNAFEFWLKSYARRPDKVSKRWQLFLDVVKWTNKNLYEFIFCLETAYALLTRLMLAKAGEDYELPDLNVSTKIISTLNKYSRRNELPLITWGLAILDLRENMRYNLVESVFEEDIFDWWDSEFLEIKNFSLKKILTTKMNDTTLEFCKTLAELILKLVKFNFEEIVGDPIGELYQNYFDKETRKNLGEFYTPIEVVEYILDGIGYNDDNPFILNKRLIDPACGSGTFLTEALKRFLAVAELKKDPEDNFFWSKTLTHLCHEFRIIGLDIHPFAVLMSQIHYLLILMPYYKKAISENKNFIIKRIPIFRTDSLWDTTLKKTEMDKGIAKYIFEDTEHGNVFIKFTLPIKINKDFLEINIKMPKTEKVMSETDIHNITEYFAALQAMFDAVKELANTNNFQFSKEIFEIKLKSYLEEKKWDLLSDFFLEYGNGILNLVKDLRYKFGDGRLIKSIEDVTLAGFIKTPKYVQYDFVVGNPPYVNIRKINKSQKDHYKIVYTTAKGSFDLYCLFIEKGFLLLTTGGKLGFITSNQFLLTSYGEHLRDFLMNPKDSEDKSVKIEQIIDFRDSRVFEDVINYPCILIFSKISNTTKSNMIKCIRVIKPQNLILQNIKNNLLRTELSTEYYDLFEYPQEKLSNEIWTFMPDSEEKVYNHILNEKDNAFGEIAENIFVGTQTSRDKIYLVFITHDLGKKKVKIRPKGEKRVYEFERDLLKPVLKGKDVTKWLLKWSNHWLIFPYKKSKKNVSLSHIKLQNDYPKAWNYFNTYKTQITGREGGKMKNRADWYAFIYPKNHGKFEQIKLMSQLLSRNNRFSLDIEGHFYFVAVGGNCITLKDKYKDITYYKYLLGLLNSSTLDFFMKHISPVHDGGFYLFIYQYLTKLPIIIEKQAPEQMESIVVNVDKIFELLRLKKKLKAFPDLYLQPLVEKGIELEEISLPFESNITKLDPIVIENDSGYQIKVSKKDELIPVETLNKANYLKLALKGQKVQKGEEIKINLPRQDNYIPTILKEYRNDEDHYNTQNINDYEDYIDKIVFEIFNLSPKDILTIEKFRERYSK